MSENKPKRKTHTSSEVKARYNKKTYKHYSFALRINQDAEIIEKIENEKQNGLSTAQAIKKLIIKNKPPQ